MNTHELADTLERFARILRNCPTVAIEDIELVDRKSKPKEQSRHIAVNVATLSKLSQIDKQEWLSFIEEYEIPLDLRPRDASRDIIGKLLRYLDEHPEMRGKIERPRSGKSEEESPELMKALSFLLKDSKE